MIDKKIIEHYIDLGLSVVPVGLNKSPTIQWKKYQSIIMDKADIDKIFYNSSKIGIVGGNVSGGLEIIDFDNHDGNASVRLKGLTSVSLLKRLPYEKTPSGGFHFFYRTNINEGNQKIAQIYLDEKIDTVIETRAEGGYAVVAPSDGYIMCGNLSFDDIPLLTDDERNYLINRLRIFNEVVGKEEIIDEVYDSINTHSDRPGDLYNRSNEAENEAKALLKREGWTSSYNDKHWTRPGKNVKDGISATFGVYKKDDGTPLFHVFTPNASPFEQNKNYTPYSIFTYLSYNGNFKDASKELRNQRGYGIPVKNTPKKQIVLVKEIADKINPPKEEKEEKHKTNFLKEAKLYISEHYELRFNEVNNKIEARELMSNKWTNADENSIYCALTESGIKINMQSVKAILGSDFAVRYNPFEEFFHNIHPYDGIDYFEELTRYISVDDPPFFSKMLEKHFVRAIKCALEPEYYNRMAFVLQSTKQEIFKSRFIKWLNPFPDSMYYSETELSNSKDCQISLAENFIYNLEELDDLKNNRISSIKALLARSTINIRRPYGAQNVIMPRRCTFFASTNFSEFLTDSENTRWLIFEVDSIAEDLFSRVNPIDLWSQAWAFYNLPDYQYELTPDERIKREERNMHFTENTVEEELLVSNFEPYESENENDPNYHTVTEIILMLNLIGRNLRLTNSVTVMSNILDNLGYHYKEFKCYKKSIKKYGIKPK